MGNHRLEVRVKVHANTFRTDNCVKNHFYSKLRKALKKINKVISHVYRKEIKEIKPNVLYRIVEVVE